MKRSVYDRTDPVWGVKRGELMKVYHVSKCNNLTLLDLYMPGRSWHRMMECVLLIEPE